MDSAGRRLNVAQLQPLQLGSLCSLVLELRSESCNGAVDSGCLEDRKSLRNLNVIASCSC